MSDPYSNLNPYRPLESENPKPSTKPIYDRPPQVIFWEMVYCGFMLLLYLAVAVLGIGLFVNAELWAEDREEFIELRVFGVVFLVVGLVLSALYAAGFVFRRGMFGWVFHIVLIAIGLTSACFWLTNIPLLIFWIKHKDYIVDSGR
jgi:hypothetical protein